MNTKKTRIKANAITTRLEFERIVDDISRSSVQLRKLEAARDRRIQEIRTEWDGPIASEIERIQNLMLLAEKFAADHRPELLPGKAKSAETPLATYGFRLGNQTLKTLNRSWNWEKVLAALDAEALTQFIRTTREPNKDAMKQHLDEAELARVGCRIEQAETFFIEPKDQPTQVAA